jgi:inorganic pyrophosphatase/K(+)-stimulated pyrophosphate-energized sodium pump
MTGFHRGLTKCPRIGRVLGVLSCLHLLAGPALAQGTEAATATASGGGFGLFLGWIVALAGSIVALVFAYRFYHWMLEQDAGTETMVRIAGYVKQGADAYLWRQYKVVTVFFLVTSGLLAIVAFGLDAQSGLVPFAFLTGGFFSGLAGWFGMKTATAASSRTAQAAKQSLNAGLQVAFRSGAVMGLTVVGLGLIDICLWFAVLYWIAPHFPVIGHEFSLEEITVTMLCFGMGASSQALFARVGGGIFTKAADVGADLVGKVEAGIPEDDPRNPATIADNVGDNVGDVAGMGADLYESYCGSILASAALGVAAYAGHPKMQLMMLMLPLVLAGVGIGLSIFGMFLVRTDEGASQLNLLRALGRGVNGSSVGIAVASAVLVWLMLVLPSSGSEELAAAGLRHGSQMFGVCAAIVIGLFAGVIIGRWTEYSTSDVYAPTRHIADQAVTGPATVIIAGIAEGFYSVWFPVVVIGISILLAFGACTGFTFQDPQLFAMGLYGVGIAAVGMLSTLGITLATDAYGPIADNAGGNAQMSKLEPLVRERTDALDSLGNTTAATGKGFAIGSAALTALALLAAYLEEVRIGFDRWAASPVVSVETAPENLETSRVLRVAESLIAINQGGRNRAYLLFPEAHDLAGLKDADISDRTPSLKVVRDSMQQILATEPGQEVEQPVDLAVLTAMQFAVPVRQATMPDFVRFYDISIMNPKVLVGMFMGVMLTFVFCALTMKAVGRAAGRMVEEVRRQFREIVGIMEGKAEPDYAACVEISTAAAQKEMVLPACLGLFVPLVVGIVLGVGGVMGMLAGGLTSGFAVAIMMANAGGAWDNAKKYIESGAHGGKGTVAHKAAVVGDTVGDPFKDTSGPSLNILIKLMSMVSVVFAGLVVQYALNL